MHVFTICMGDGQVSKTEVHGTHLGDDLMCLSDSFSDEVLVL